MAKQVKLELVQNNNVLTFTTNIESQEATVLSGTIAYRIIDLFAKSKKFKMNLGGFSFARKFDVKISIEGVETVSGSKTFFQETTKFGITLRETQESITNFGEFIGALVYSATTGLYELEINQADLVSEVEENLINFGVN